MPKVPKISLHIFAVSPEKHGVWNWFSLPADKHKNFLQIDSITLDVHVQSTKNNKYISLQYLKENIKNEADFCLLEIATDFFKVIQLF